MFKLEEPFNHVYSEGGYVSIPEFYSGKSIFVTGGLYLNFVIFIVFQKITEFFLRIFQEFF